MAEEGDPADAVSTGRFGGDVKWGVLAVAIGFGIVIGFLATWGLLNTPVAAAAFFVGFIGGAWYLYRKQIPSAAIASGLYITALELILVPIAFYVPNVVSEPETASEAGMFIGSVLGLVIWGFVFFLIAIVVAALGYAFSRRAQKKLADN